MREGGSYLFDSSLPPSSTSQTLRLAGQLLQSAHLRTYLAEGIELETFGFQVQVTYHLATHPSIEQRVVDYILNVS